jgi:hypothetical protein
MRQGVLVQAYVQLIVDDWQRFRPLSTGMALACVLRRLYPQEWKTDRYDVLSPPVLSFLRELVERCREAGVALSICGEMAARPLEAMVLLGLGVRNLSMTATDIGPVKAMPRALRAPAGGLSGSAAEPVRLQPAQPAAPLAPDHACHCISESYRNPSRGPVEPLDRRSHAMRRAKAVITTAGSLMRELAYVP